MSVCMSVFCRSVSRFLPLPSLAPDLASFFKDSVRTIVDLPVDLSMLLCQTIIVSVSFYYRYANAYNLFSGSQNI